MYLKQLDIFGFKSFGRDTTIHWSPGVSVLVGPNGGGKSNIVDAIRFALGEQRLRDLRLERWEDVLHGGADTGAVAQLAEVVLTFAGMESSDGEPLIVSRRYYRSGESEYLINGRTVRLKDVTDRFLDSGLGRSRYAVISQGRVEQALFLRPRERLEQLEEAAGVSRYKVRRKETLAHLDDVQRQIARLGDLSYETERQMREVQAAAEREQRYLVLEHERQELSARLDGHAYLSQQRDLANRRAQIAVLRQNHSQAGEELAVLEKRREEKRREEERGADAHAQWSKTSEEAEGALQRARQEAARIAGQQEGLGRQLFDVQERLERLHARQDALSVPEEGTPNEEWEHVIKRLEEEISAAEIAETETAQALADLNRQLRAAEDEQRRALEELARGEKLLARLEGVLGTDAELEVGDRLERMARDADGLGREVERLTREMDRLVGERDRLSGFIRDLTARIDPLRHQLAGRQARLRSLYQLEAEGAGLSQGVRSVLDAGRDNRLTGIVGTAGTLIETDTSLMEALGVALGAAGQNVVVQTEAEARAAVSWLIANNRGRATFLPLDTVRPARFSSADRHFGEAAGMLGWALDLVQFPEKIWPAASHLLGRVLVSESLEAAVEVGRRHNFRFKTVTLDGQLLHAGGAITGGSRRESNDRSARRQEIRVLTERLEEDRERLSAQEELLAGSQNELKALEVRMDGIREQLTERRLAWQSQVERQNALRQFGDAGELVRSMSALRERKASAEARLGQLKAELDTAERRHALNRARVQPLRVGLEQKRAEWERNQIIRSRVEDEARHLRDEIAAAAERLTQLEAADAALREAAARREQEIEALNASTEEHLNRRREVSERLSQLQNERLALENRQGVLYAQERRLEQRINQLEQECFKIQTRWEDFSPDPDLIPFENDAEVVAAAEKVDALVKEQRALGAVVGGSLRIYQQLKARFDELKGETDDVLAAKAELLAVIDDLDTETHRRLQLAADQVQRAFVQTCKELFGGGDAGFTWVEEGERGLDLWVCPPGKRPGSLSLLSGGEKALGGIAWIFALIGLRPVPFVILDEAEASLDEANARRFAQYLDRHRERAQFIVVSHLKPTMEVADVLWGVTHNGRGLSQLVSVQLEPGEILSGG